MPAYIGIYIWETYFDFACYIVRAKLRVQSECQHKMTYQDRGRQLSTGLPHQPFFMQVVEIINQFLGKNNTHNQNKCVTFFSTYKFTSVPQQLLPYTSNTTHVDSHHILFMQWFIHSLSIISRVYFLFTYIGYTSFLFSWPLPYSIIAHFGISSQIHWKTTRSNYYSILYCLIHEYLFNSTIDILLCLDSPSL